MQCFENSYLRIKAKNSIKKRFSKKIFSIFFGNGSNYFLTFGKILRKDCQKCFLRVQKHVEGTDFFNFIPFLSCCRILSKTFLTCGSKFFHKAVKTGSNVFRRQFWWKKNISENCFFFEIWAIFFLTFDKNYSTKLAELLSKRSDEHYHVQPTNSLKNSSSLFGFWSKVFLNFRNPFLQKCENSFLRTDTNTSIRKIFFENFASFFGIRSKHFLTFGKHSTERLSELFSTCSKTCWRNKLFQFFFLFLLSNRTLSKTFLTFGKKYSTNFLKLPSTSSDEHCDEKNRFLIFFSFKIWKYFFNLSTIFPQSWQNCF